MLCSIDHFLGPGLGLFEYFVARETPIISIEGGGWLRKTRLFDENPRFHTHTHTHTPSKSVVLPPFRRKKHVLHRDFGVCTTAPPVDVKSCKGVYYRGYSTINRYRGYSTINRYRGYSTINPCRVGPA
jgi:hypothetical protein